jgi:hypothetical protein
MLSQIILHLRRNARLRDLNRLRRHQLRNLNILLPHSRRLVRLCRIHLRADDAVTRDKEVTCQVGVSTLMDDPRVAIAIRRALSVFKVGHHHKLKVLSSKDQLQQ